MPKGGGYMGKIGLVDLSSETISEYPLKEWERYLGGKILNQGILLDLLTGKETAFSEENPIILSTGPLTGTGVPGSMRFDMASLSPKDDRPAFSNCGGNFGLYMKKAGYDGLILTGRCKEKRWLEVNGERIVFHDAAGLWSSRVSECQEILAGYLGNQHFGGLSIGPAGENLVKYATVTADGHSTGRAGIGAVLGWKNLKAVTVSGRKEVSLFDSEGAAALNKDWYAFLRQHRQKEDCVSGNTFCRGCPLRCAKHDRESNGILNELGMDSIAAADAVRWAGERGFSDPNIYADIAYRRGIGDRLADGVSGSKGKGGNRRGGSYQAITAAVRLPPDAPETNRFCKNLTEAISAAGQCMFTVNGLAGDTAVYVVQMLQLVTGMEMDLERLLEIGGRSQELERQLRDRHK